MSKKEVIKNIVQEYRQKLGMTQEELAQAVAVSRQTIIALEKGNYIPSVLLAIKLAKVFNTKVENIFALIYEK